MNYRIKHITRYDYSDPVTLCQNLARLSPLNTVQQQCQKVEFNISPTPSYTDHYLDYFGNRVTRFDIPEQHQSLVVEVQSLVTLTERPQSELFSFDPPWEQIRDALAGGLTSNLLQAREYSFSSTFVPLFSGVRDYALISFTPGRPILEATHELMHRIFTEFTYDPCFTTLSTPVSTVLEHKRGVCQDFAHLAIACLRSLGLAARYVSGYIETLPPEGQEKLEGADASHAWFSLFLPERGWLDFDPTNDIVPDIQHITLAVGRDYFDVTPLKGVLYGGGQHQLNVSVDVARLP